MEFKNNPQAVFNGFVSLSRNIYLTSTVGIAMFGYSNSFKITFSEIMIRVISICIFIFSTIYLVNGTLGFRNYLNNLEKENNTLPYYVDLKTWRNYEYINYLYLAFLLLVITMSFVRTFNFVIGKKK